MDDQRTVAAATTRRETELRRGVGVAVLAYARVALSRVHTRSERRTFVLIGRTFVDHCNNHP